MIKELRFVAVTFSFLCTCPLLAIPLYDYKDMKKYSADGDRLCVKEHGNQLIRIENANTEGDFIYNIKI